MPARWRAARPPAGRQRAAHAHWGVVRSALGVPRARPLGVQHVCPLGVQLLLRICLGMSCLDTAVLSGFWP